MFLMALITSDVLYRTLAGKSIVGAYELAEITMVPVTYFTIAYCQKYKGHVRMEFVVDRLRGKTRHLSEIIALFLSLSICVVIFYRAIVEAQQAVGIGLVTSGVVQWPAWPFKIVLIYGFSLICIRLGIQLVQQIRLLIAEGGNHAK